MSINNIKVMICIYGGDIDVGKRKKFPSNFVCPPKEAYSYSKVLYKFSATNKENDSYLRNTYADSMKPFDNPKKMCQACGHSVFLNEEDMIKLKSSKGRVSKGVMKKWNYINAFMPSDKSKILNTPSKTSRDYHTYWHYGKINMIFCCLKKYEMGVIIYETFRI